MYLKNDLSLSKINSLKVMFIILTIQFLEEVLNDAL